MRAGGQKGGPRMIIQEQVDRAYRVAYRLAYPVVQRLRGLLKLDQFVAVAVWLDDTVLAVRHSYKPGLTLVYGGVGRRENHRLAAARELQEEVGITVHRDTLRLVMVTPNMHLYELRLTEPPELQIDRREVVEACFMHPGGLREARRGGKVREYLRRHAGVGSDG
jgi:8-oxo-dGTP pyrophosphatase MutT (NUDIX family)